VQQPQQQAQAQAQAQPQVQQQPQAPIYFGNYQPFTSYAQPFPQQIQPVSQAQPVQQQQPVQGATQQFPQQQQPQPAFWPQQQSYLPPRYPGYGGFATLPAAGNNASNVVASRGYPYYQSYPSFYNGRY